MSHPRLLHTFAKFVSRGQGPVIVVLHMFSLGDAKTHHNRKICSHPAAGQSEIQLDNVTGEQQEGTWIDKYTGMF